MFMNMDEQMLTNTVGMYLTPPGLHVEHVGRVFLQCDDLSEVHVPVEELRGKRSSFRTHTTAQGP